MLEEKEQDPREKYQLEYNQAVAQLGHNESQQDVLKNENSRLRDQIQKILKKAANLPKPEPKEEIHATSPA